MAKRTWLFKSEAESYSLDDLERDGQTFWDGVRNYQARNLLRDEVSVGDAVLFYHSASKEPAVVGLAEVVVAYAPDPTQFDPKSPYYDAASKRQDPRWGGVSIAFRERFQKAVSLAAIKADARFANMLLVQRGQRLSIQAVEQDVFRAIVALGRGTSTKPKSRARGQD